MGDCRRPPARHMSQCSAAARRMRDGLALLRSDPQIRRAFELANLAMLIQQLRARREARTASFDQDTSTLYFEQAYETLDLNSEKASGVPLRVPSRSLSSWHHCVRQQTLAIPTGTSWN